MAFTLFGKKGRQPDDLLPPGWQFYSRPTSLEPPGTVFRIDPDGRRFIVTQLTPAVLRGPEPGASRIERIETRMSVLARLFGLQPMGVRLAAGTVKTLRFQIIEPVRTSTTDAVMDDVLRPFVAAMEFRKGNRYFVIRETRSATAMIYFLSKEEIGEVGGEAAIIAAGEGDVTLGVGSADLSEVTQSFPERLDVMFLADEIRPVVANLGAGEDALGRAAVAAPFDWVDPEYATVQVFFGTDRSINPGAGPASLFGTDRSELRYGACEVSVPRDHRMGHLEAPSIFRLEFREDPARHVVLLKAETHPRQEFFAELAARARDSADRSALLFVHGYNVTFEDAARRTGQIAYDLGYTGAPVFYSWPSQGTTRAYTVDEANIEWTVTHLEGFLRDLVERSDAERLYLIGHSMGSRALTRAVATLVAEQPHVRARLSEVILAAPDIDADVFRDQIAPALTAGGHPVTLYASATDVALMASKAVHGSPRAGDAGHGLILLDAIETIDASAVDTSLAKHSYFAKSKSVLADIFSLVRNGSRPAERFGLRRIDTAAGHYWEFKP
jgi:esterase/lipase superfamily enzyme